MSTRRYPVLLWRDAGGGFTAALVADFDDACAYAETETEALNQLKELLHWRNEHQPWLAEPDLAEPSFFEVKVEVRPEYKHERRPIPAPDTVWLRVPCVSGVDANGMKICCLPHLRFSFNYQETEALKPLVAHYVRDELRALHPMQLFQKLPPNGCELREIIVRAPTGRSITVPPLSRPELKLLLTVADPLAQSSRGKAGTSTAYGRDGLVAAVVARLSQDKANVLLIGESGVGKTTLLVEAAKRITRQESVDENEIQDLRVFRFWRTSGGRLIAGMAYLGEWEERCEAVIEKLNEIEGVLCTENLLEMVQAGGQAAGGSVAAFLLPYLQRGELRLCAEATPAELEACRRLLPALLDVFQIVHVTPFEETEALQVLTKIAAAAASGRRVEFDPVIPLAVQRWFARFQPSSQFPGQAAHFVKRLFEGKSGTITLQAATEAFIRQTGLPEIFLRDDLPMRPEDVRAELSRKIIGQTAAVDRATRVITTIKAGLADSSRPFGVLLFSGPTGVGKTALAKAIATYCFGAGGDDARRLIRLDMSEYGSWGAAQRLLAGPENRAAEWIQRVRAQPFCVVLFDEIEKADPEVFDVLLGLLDEGRLTDQFGRVTNFRSAIIILTSNLGSTARVTAGFGFDSGPSYYEEVARFFRPEFFNRLDAVVAFKPLTLGDAEEITRKELTELAAREGFSADGIQLDWTDELVSHLAREGYDQRLGARPLQRAIERLVVTPLARWKVNHPNEKNVTLRLEFDGEKKVILRNPALQTLAGSE